MRSFSVLEISNGQQRKVLALACTKYENNISCLQIKLFQLICIDAAF